MSDDTPQNNSSKDKKVCVPCSSLDASAVLSAQDIDDQLQQQPGALAVWKHHTGAAVPKLSWTFTAKNFQSALDALNAMGRIAEDENHHPDFHLTGYRNVCVELYTHSVGGITQNDIALAQRLSEQVKVAYSPKWLKEHPEAALSSA